MKKFFLFFIIFCLALAIIFSNQKVHASIVAETGPIGYLDDPSTYCTNGITGWACNGNGDNNQTQVNIDDESITSGLQGLGYTFTSVIAPDASTINKQCGGTTQYRRFVFPLPSSMKDGKTHIVYAKIWTGLSSPIIPFINNTKSFSCPAPTQTSPTNTQQSCSPSYYLQPDQCQTSPLGPISKPGHTFKIQKNCDGTFNCIADCTTDPSQCSSLNNTNAQNSPTPTPSLSPSATPTPTPSSTTGDVTVHLEGIDSNNTPPPGQQKNKTRNIVLFFYKDLGTPVDFKSKPTYIFSGKAEEVVDNTKNYNGFFRQSNFPLNGLTDGKYFVLVKVKEGSFVTQIGNNSIQLFVGKNNILVNVDNSNVSNGAPISAPLLTMGDIVTICDTNNPTPDTCSYNSVDIFDYDALKDCFGYPNIKDASQANFCNAHKLTNGYEYNIADINDDGTVDGIDYTILLKYFNQTGIGGVSQNSGKDH